jgi:O-acetyl-ADP-ribose deacetylase (regulator of RNase III)
MIHVIQRDITDIGDGTPEGVPYYNPDCIVNASNQELQKGCGVSGAIHDAVGLGRQTKHITGEEPESTYLSRLEEDAEGIERMAIGSAVLQRGHGLCPWIIQTHPPRLTCPEELNWRSSLKHCYNSCLQLWTGFVLQHYAPEDHGTLNKNSTYLEPTSFDIAFPMLGTGAYKLPREEADEIAADVCSLWDVANRESGEGFTQNIWLVISPWDENGTERMEAMQELIEMNSAVAAARPH